MMAMMEWAEQELKLVGYDINDPEDGPDRWLAEGTLELLKVFSEQGHSGMSAPYAVALSLGRTAATVWCLKERMVKHTGSRAECSGSGLRILRSMMENHSRVTIQVVKAE